MLYDTMSRLSFFMLYAFASVPAALAIDAALQVDEHIPLIKAATYFVLAIVGVIAWLDARIDKKISRYEESSKLREKLLLQEVRHVKELLVHRGGSAPPPSSVDPTPTSE